MLSQSSCSDQVTYFLRRALICFALCLRSFLRNAANASPDATVQVTSASLRYGFQAGRATIQAVSTASVSLSSDLIRCGQIDGRQLPPLSSHRSAHRGLHAGSRETVGSLGPCIDLEAPVPSATVVSTRRMPVRVMHGGRSWNGPGRGRIQGWRFLAAQLALAALDPSDLLTNGRLCFDRVADGDWRGHDCKNLVPKLGFQGRCGMNLKTPYSSIRCGRAM